MLEPGKVFAFYRKYLFRNQPYSALFIPNFSKLGE